MFKEASSRRGRRLLSVASCSLATLSAAEPLDDDPPVFEMEPFVVEAQQFSRVDSFSIVSVDFLEEADLSRMAQTTLGETLSWQPGVSSSYFGPGSSRPVIRGFAGYRVRMLQDGIGTLDVSDSSPDHGVALEPLLIREIDIHRGPSALLYGSAAIGGAVNATTRNIPGERPTQTATGSVETRYDTASNGKAAAAYTHLAVDDFVVTVTGSARSSDDYDIPGNARTAEYDATFNPQVNDPNAGATVPVPNPSGTLPNTFHDSHSWSAGLAWLPEGLPFAVGGAFSKIGSEYGVPYQYAGDPNDLFGFSSLDLHQQRVDFDARIDPETGWLETLHFHIGYADYGHTETFTGLDKDADKIFDDTLFDQDAVEGRVEWFHRPADWIEGVAGFQGQRQDLEVSFLAAPPMEASRFGNRFITKNFGFFLLETLSWDDWSMQLGGRYENQAIQDVSFQEFGFVTNQPAESYSLAGSLTWRRESIGLLDELAITPSASMIERVPSATERYAFWPNPAIQRFLIGGDRDGSPLGNERSLGAELGIEAKMGKWSGRFNAYHYHYDNFIFLQDIKGIGNLAQYVEREATFSGFEAEVGWTQALDQRGTLLTLTAMSDYVRGHNEADDQPLPRMPPLRVGGRAELEWRDLIAGLELRYAFSQERVQPETAVVLPELTTDAYTEVNLDLSYDWSVARTTLTTFLRLSNLLDKERRIHTSFIKDVAPLPGRSLSLGARWSF